jgi:mercuric ion transport protein
MIGPTATEVATQLLTEATTTLGWKSSHAMLAPQEEAVLRYVMIQYPLRGSSPSREAIGVALSIGNPDEVQAALGRLEKVDLLCLDPERREIRCAYPFSSFPTKHVVTFLNWSETRPVYAMCAVDALGIPFMFHRDVAIKSSCPHCGRPITIEVRNRRIASYAPAEVVVWMTSNRTECAAASVCPTLNFFCSQAHVEAWRKASAKEAGFVLSLGEALFVARGLFGGLLTKTGNSLAGDNGSRAVPLASQETATAMTTVGGLLAAFLASLCCVGPLVLTALGIGVGATGFLAGAAGALKALLPYRPVFIGLTALLLGAGFYFTCRTPKSGCGSGATCVPTSGQRRSRLLLWVASALALGFILSPYWLGL